MASSSKASSSKRPSSNCVYGVTPAVSLPMAQELVMESPHWVMVDNAVRVLGNTSADKTALFLPASAEECSTLVNNFRRFPNSAPPAFHLPQYAHPEKIDFQRVTANLPPSPAPATFYPPRYVCTCSVFNEGHSSQGEGLLLYQALIILQRGFAKIINGHHSKTENGRRLLQFLGHPNTTACLRYYHEHWHYTISCPLFAPVLIALICDFCEDHLSTADYRKWIYNSRAKEGYGMSSRTRQPVKDCLEEPIALKLLAIPIPFDPQTREGQIIVTIASRGSDSDQIRQPFTDITFRPDPAKRVVTPKPSRAPPIIKSSMTALIPPRPLTPEDDEDTESNGSSLHGASVPSSPQPFPVPDSPPAMVEDEAETDDIFLPAPEPAPTIPRRSLAHAAKAKPAVPEVAHRSVPAAVVKRARSSSTVDPEVYLWEAWAFGGVSRLSGLRVFFLMFIFLVFNLWLQNVPEPAPKKRRTQPSMGRTRARTPVPPASSSTLPKQRTPLRIQEGLPDYFDDDDIRTSGHKDFVTNPNFKPKAPFSHCLALEEHKDRLLAIHNTVQGFPAGYSGSLDRFQRALADYDRVQASFSTILNDSRQWLAQSLQDVRANGFDFNVVLSKWAEDNPNLPLEYDMLVWLSTLFGWDSSCNISQYLSNPADTARLEAFLHSNDPVLPSVVVPELPPSTSTCSSSAATSSDPAPSSRDPDSATLPQVPSSFPTDPVPPSHRRPAAAVPINFGLGRNSHTPPASTAADNDMDVEDGASRTSAGQALVAEYDDSEEEDDDDAKSDDDGDDDDDAEGAAVATLAPARSSKTRK
ncbi:hypothetical protein FB446DRAFT_709644 [Lentinula raphanica]|nr:hypothetical protein FB446DRAFT_709644 [Lentinula raphanica]